MNHNELFKRILRQFIPNAGTVIVVLALLWARDVGALGALSSTSTTTISYQGRLADGSGNPITNAGLGMTFRLYNTTTGGSALWTETYSGVSVNNGLFHVLLGSTTPLSASIFSSNNTLYLGITVGGDTEMTPREQLGSAPYAMQASQALTVPNGSITTAKIADGAIGSTKIADAAVTTNKLANNSLTNMLFVASSTSLELQEDSQWHDDPTLSVTGNFSGGNILIELSSPGMWCDTGAHSIDTRLLIDNQEVSKARVAFSSSGGYSERYIGITWAQTLTSGNHTIKVQWSAEAGSNRAVAGFGSTRTLTVFEFKK